MVNDSFGRMGHTDRGRLARMVGLHARKLESVARSAEPDDGFSNFYRMFGMPLPCSATGR